MQKSNKYRLTETGKPSFFSMTRGGISIPPVEAPALITIAIAILLMLTAMIPRKIRRKKKIQPQQTVEVVQIPS